MTAKAYPRNMPVHTGGSKAILGLLFLHRLCFMCLSTRPVEGLSALQDPSFIGCPPLAGGGSRKLLRPSSHLVRLHLASHRHHPRASTRRGAWAKAPGEGPLKLLCLVGLRLRLRASACPGGLGEGSRDDPCRLFVMRL